MKRGFLAALLLAVCGSVFSAEEVKDISHQELVDAVNSGKITLLDCNKTLTYNKNHIPGALNYNKVKNELAVKLPADKNALVVAYCGNPDCQAYKFGATAALELGYTNVKHYAGGIEGWLKAHEKTESVETK